MHFLIIFLSSFSAHCRRISAEYALSRSVYGIVCSTDASVDSDAVEAAVVGSIDAIDELTSYSANVREISMYV